MKMYYRTTTDSKGNQQFYVKGKLHNENGPAIRWADGGREWYKNGQCHREDGPAIERADGTKYWYKNDQLHREDGPAIERADGSKEWYIEGKRLTEAEFAARQRKSAPCEGKKITVEGVEYILTAVAGKAKVGA